MWSREKASDTCLDKVAWHMTYMRSTRVFGLPLVFGARTSESEPTLPLSGCYESLATTVEIAWDQRIDARAMDWNLQEKRTSGLIFDCFPEEDLRPLFACLSCDSAQYHPRFFEVLSDLPSPPVGLDAPLRAICHDYLIVRQGGVKLGASYDRIRFTTPLRSDQK
jgi:hypothetical protein